MSNTNIEQALATEKGALDHEREIIEQMRALREDLAASRASRRHVHEALDEEVAEETQAALAEAKAKVATFKAEQADAKDHQLTLERRTKQGDDSVTVEDLTRADKAVERATNLLQAANRDLSKAEKAAKQADCDQHLAHLVADAIEAVSEATVILRRNPADAPEIADGVILSQTDSTEGYGTLTASGSVDPTIIGDPDINWVAVQTWLEDLGCDLNATKNGIHLNVARWKQPLLHRASPGWLGKLAGQVCEQIKDSVQYKRAPRTGEIVGHSSATALTEVANTSLQDDAGDVHGTVELLVSVSHVATESNVIEKIVKDALGDFKHLGDTPVGRIDSLDVASVHAEPDYVFENAGISLGRGPMPWRITVEVAATYEPTGCAA